MNWKFGYAKQKNTYVQIYNNCPNKYQDQQLQQT